MNDTAIKNYAMWARRELIAEVGKRCSYYGIYLQGSPEATADVIGERVLSATEKKQRACLLECAQRDGYEQLVERAAYTWFNRLLAIRFMEVNDRLPSHVRVLSAPDGSFKPQALAEAMDLPLEALDRDRVVQLVQVGDDEALFRLVFLAQCDELAGCMPAVFDKVGSAMELLLPDGLLRTGGAAERLVTDIPEDDWREGVEIVGWMYQYYVSERKDEVFASFKKGKKAEREAIAPATQLFTPNWIVRYLTENSLGRLWMLNHPESALPERMPYFVKPDEDAETEFKRVSGPEEISVVDPGCGSGHILVYAFDLLASMYAEAGYSARDAARLILEKNISGLEIDPRAAAMASFCLTCKACELDGRFLRRGVSPRITVLSRVEFEPEEKALLHHVRNDLDLLDAAAHLDECGSLFHPSHAQLDAIARDLASLSRDGSIFAASAAEKLQQLQAELEPLAERYDVVVANPPYMGSSSFDKWMGSWVKERYPEAYRDLCTSFIDRGFTLSAANGYSAMVTMQSWMFLGSYEKLRGKILHNHAISSMAHLGARAFGAIGGEVVSTTATVFSNRKTNAPGTYLRLVDMGSEAEKQAGALEALANPDCGWFYRADSKTYSIIPTHPIAYWISKPMKNVFTSSFELSSYADVKKGISTGDNESFLKLWWEVSRSRSSLYESRSDATYFTLAKWFAYNKGGEFRKWYGNNDYIINWENNGEALRTFNGAILRNQKYYFMPSITWSDVSSGCIAFRAKPSGGLHDGSGASLFVEPEKMPFLLGMMNCSVIREVSKMLSPTLHFEIGQVSSYPIQKPPAERKNITERLVANCIALSRADWDSFETSWDFARHPLV